MNKKTNSKKLTPAEQPVAASSAAERFPKRKRQVQDQLPGTAAVQDPELSRLAFEYVEARDYRMQLTGEEVAARDALLAAMTGRGLSHYRDEQHELVVEIVVADVKVKVTHYDVEKGESAPAKAAAPPANGAASTEAAAR